MLLNLSLEGEILKYNDMLYKATYTAWIWYIQPQHLLGKSKVYKKEKGVGEGTSYHWCCQISPRRLIFVAFQLQKVENDSRHDEFELTYLREASSENTKNKTKFQNQQHRRQQQQQFFIQLLRWITLEGDEFVHIETFSDLEDVFLLLDVIAKLRNPLLTTVLISEPDPQLITVSTSSVHVDVECLLFCMFPT